MIFLINMALFGAVISVVSSFVMLSWNYAIPRLAESVDPTYEVSKFKKISYPVAMVLTLLSVFLFSNMPSRYWRPEHSEYIEIREAVPSLVDHLGSMDMSMGGAGKRRRA